jgi:murein DD-endopeptidase MepM/ murein hydrolase activator NlpD
VKQGEVLRVTAKDPDLTAVLLDRKAPLFKQDNGEYLGLMPVTAITAPGSYEMTVVDKSGKVVRKTPVVIQDADYPKQNIVASKAMKSLTPLPGEMEAVRALQATVSPKRFWSEPFEHPTPQCMNSRFGVTRLHNGKPTGNYHRGLDLRSPMGVPVHATTAGVVKVAQMFRLHGGTVGIDHGQGVTSMYLHLSKLAVPEGTEVKPGDVVGYVGATGFATGPHLHWQVHVQGVPVNPAIFAGKFEPCMATAPRKPVKKRAVKSRPVQ